MLFLIFILFVFLCDGSHKQTTYYYDDMFISCNVIDDMNKYNITYENLSSIVRKENYKCSFQGKDLYVDQELNDVCVVVNKGSSTVVSVSVHKDKLWLDKFLEIKDAHDKKSKIRNRK